MRLSSISLLAAAASLRTAAGSGIGIGILSVMGGAVETGIKKIIISVASSKMHEAITGGKKPSPTKKPIDGSARAVDRKAGDDMCLEVVEQKGRKPCRKYLVTTTTRHPVTSTVTSTTTGSSTVTVTLPAQPTRAARGTPAVPKYASKCCSDFQQYSSACSRLGVGASTETAAPTIVTTTETATVQPTVVVQRIRLVANNRRDPFEGDIYGNSDSAFDRDAYYIQFQDDVGQSTTFALNSADGSVVALDDPIAGDFGYYSLDRPASDITFHPVDAGYSDQVLLNCRLGAANALECAYGDDAGPAVFYLCARDLNFALPGTDVSQYCRDPEIITITAVLVDAA